MNTLERTAWRASRDDFENRTARLVAIFAFVLALVILFAQKQITHQSTSGGGVQTGIGPIAQPNPRIGHPSSYPPNHQVTDCERERAWRDIDLPECR